MTVTMNSVCINRDDQPCRLNINNLVIPDGQKVALLGFNGSGKTTMFRALLGLELFSGDIVFDADPCIAFVAQNPESMFCTSNVFDEVAFGARNIESRPEIADERIHSSMNLCQLESIKDRELQSLSGGQKQLVAIASALSMNPSMLLLDEPCSMLDAKSRDVVLGVLRQLPPETTVIHATHRIQDVLGYDRCIVLENGLVEFDGSIDDFLANDGFSFRYCSFPTTETVRFCECEPAIERDGLVLDRCSYAFPDASARTRHVQQPGMSLQDISASLTKGQLALLVGPIGAGKTTILCLAAGLLRCSAGTVALYGRPVQPGQVGICFQNCAQQVCKSTVLSDVAFGCKNMGATPLQAEKAARKALELCGISERLFDTNPFCLSGGEQRRVAIAGVLAMNTDYVLFDEPTVGLDVREIERFTSLLQTLLEEGAGIVIATHEPESFLPLASKVYEIDNGRIAQSYMRSFDTGESLFNE